MPLYFKRLMVGWPEQRPPPVDKPTSLRIFEVCRNRAPPIQSLALGDINALSDEIDRENARKCLTMFVQKAHLGPPLTDRYDKKEMHDIHRFTHRHKEVVVWRLRKSAIRVCFIYIPGQVLLIVKIQAKRSDALTKGEKSIIEAVCIAVIDQLQESSFNDWMTYG